MLYLIPLSLGAYYYRYQLGYYILKSYSQIEINYNKWYNTNYPTSNIKVFVNGTQQTDIGAIIKDIVDVDKPNIYLVEYLYKNKCFKIGGLDLDILLDYVTNIENRIEQSNKDANNKIYKWISAFDKDDNCYLDEIKKIAGPLGDFYQHAGIKLKSDFFPNIRNLSLTITDFRLDGYSIKPNNYIELKQ